GQSPLNPSKACYEMLKQMGVYLIFMWPDCGPGWGVQTIQELGDIPNLNVVWDNPRSPFHDSVKKPASWLELWVPQDSSMFYRKILQHTPISFVGSDRYPDRVVFLNYFKSKLPEYVRYLRGGQREEKLSPESY